MSDYAELVKRLEELAPNFKAYQEGRKQTVLESAGAIKSLVQERDALLAENSKLRSALSIVHFKREPWQ